MTKISNSALLKIFTKLLVLLVIAKAISLSVLWYLPSDGIGFSKKENYQPKYQRVDFKNMLIKNKGVKSTLEDEITDDINGGKSTNITNMILKGLYGNKTSGFVIVSLKSAPKKTSIVEVGEVYAGFKLKSIQIDNALFTKGSKEYILELQKPKESKSFIQKVKTTQVSEPIDNALESGVSREDIEFYSKNPKQLWKDISIKEVKEGKKIVGFKIRRINPKSKMASLGLQKNDIIIKANNVELKSYKDAINIYKNIDKIDTVQIVVMRNKEEKELVYEIN